MRVGMGEWDSGLQFYGILCFVIRNIIGVGE